MAMIVDAHVSAPMPYVDRPERSGSGRIATHWKRRESVCLSAVGDATGTRPSSSNAAFFACSNLLDTNSLERPVETMRKPALGA